MKKGVFTFVPDSGTPGDNVITVSAPPFTGRVAPASQQIRVTKQGGDSTSPVGFVTVAQKAEEFFKIDSITVPEETSDVTNIVMVCSGNVSPSSIVCGGYEFYGLYPSVDENDQIKNWIFTQGEQTVAVQPVMDASGYGLRLSNISESANVLGESASYKLTAYLTAPVNRTMDNKTYDFFIGDTSIGFEEHVNTILSPGNKLAIASKSGCRVTIKPTTTGFIRFMRSSIDFAMDAGNEQPDITVFVQAGAPWIISSEIPSWLTLQGHTDGKVYPRTESDAEYIPLVFNVTGTTDTAREAVIEVCLQGDHNVKDTLVVNQNLSDGAEEFVYISLNPNYTPETAFDLEHFDLMGDGGHVVSESGGGGFLVVMSNTEWSINSFPDWITPTTSWNPSGYEENNKHIDLYISSNYGGESREHTFEVTTKSGKRRGRYVLKQLKPGTIFVRSVSSDTVSPRLSITKTTASGNDGTITWSGTEGREVLITINVEASEDWSVEIPHSYYPSAFQNVKIYPNSNMMELVNVDKENGTFTIKLTKVSDYGRFKGNIRLFSGTILRNIIKFSGS